MVKVKEEGGTEEKFEREELVTLASGGEREIDLWAAEVSIGANYRSGNTDETEISVMLDVSRRTPDGRIRFEYLGRYLETNGVESLDYHSATARWDRYVTRRFFWTPAFAQYYRDPFQNIGHRLTVGAGIGYRLVDTAETEWTVMAGPAYRHVEFDSSGEGSRAAEDSPALIFLTDFETELTDWMDFSAGYSGYAVSEDASRYGHTALTTVSFSIGDPFEFNVSLLWDYIDRPARTSDGTIPENSDFRLMFGAGLEF